MVELSSAETGAYRNGLFRALADEQRRGVLRVLDRVDGASPAELATHLVAAEDKSLMDVTRSEAEPVQADLQHVHLPRLVDAGLVTRTDGVVRRTPHPAYRDPKLDAMLAADAPDWDLVLECLADDRRRVALSTLSRREGPMSVTALATEIAATLGGDGDRTVTGNGDDPEEAARDGDRAARDDGETEQRGVEDVRTALRHVHLPKLEAAGLVTVDADAGTVAYEGHLDLDEEWLVAGPEDAPRAILSAAEASADIWTLEGRDDLTERGRALCAAADEELFMMFTVEDAVETACLRRIRDALDRGVDVYLGTQNSELRDLVRRQAPDVVIWEPQLDWLNLPPTREAVGRLIMADREEVVIGTVGEAGPDGVPRETAITGAGEDNPLVLLVRDLLGSRLDHLDAQSEDFRSTLPL